ncbi:MAG TPA: hypothetical protein VLB79_10895 [Solirubrobacterales bacterium]|nr:hypothetical protein [Solirubrobacterales bacterium]
MSLTTDRASLAPRPSVWRMPRITAAAVLLGVCKLGFSTAMLGVGLWGRLGTEELQTLTFVTLVLGNQALLYVPREHDAAAVAARTPPRSRSPSSWIR